MSRFVFFILIVVAVIYFFGNRLTKYFFTPREISNTLNNGNLKPENTNEGDMVEIKTVFENLDIPWEMAFLPRENVLVTQRGGKLLLIGEEQRVVAEVEGVKHIGEGGLLGLALDPRFLSNRLIYLYLTSQVNGVITNRVESYEFDGKSLSNKKVILEGIRGSKNHDGGRIAFGPDGYLYITSGDAEEPNLAQDKNSLNGKILRIKTDGSIPSDNPFGNAVYSYGHRNPQGITWDEKGNLWSTEHGPSGAQTGNDEINLIVKGGNYGWPEIKGIQKRDGMITPVIESGKSDTWAPSGITYKDGYLYFAGLRGEALYKAKINADNTLSLETLYKKEFGRLRSVSVGTDGNLYLITNNRDGRGTPRQGDDKLVQVLVEK